MSGRTLSYAISSQSLYLGHCVMCKTESIFKVNASKKVPKEDWITVKNTLLEPLVTQEVFDGANEKIFEPQAGYRR